jgi:hypothetical protein
MDDGRNIALLEIWAFSEPGHADLDLRARSSRTAAKP